MFLAGFLGREDQWKEFVPKWRNGLGIQRKFLHMTDLRWKMDRTRKLLERLGPIPEECGLIPVLGGARYADYEDLIAGSREEKVLKAYVVCLSALVAQVLRVVPAHERLELVFEEQRQYERLTNMALHSFSDTQPSIHPWLKTKDGRPKLAKWSFVPKGSTIMTDPADYFAFALRESWANKESKKARWCASIMKSGKGHGIGKIYTRKEIRAQMVILQDMRRSS
jgi:hypothetical protein